MEKLVCELDILSKKGLDKKEMGREAFLEKVWEWTDEYRGRIREQLKKMGVSADFTRDRKSVV